MPRRPRPPATPPRPASPGPGDGSDGRALAPNWTARRRPAPGSSPGSSLRAEERKVPRHEDVPPAARAARLLASIDRPPLQSALQGAQRAVLQRLHGPDTLPHDGGLLRGGEVLEEAEDQNLLLLVRQLADGGVQVRVRELLDRQFRGIGRFQCRCVLEGNEHHFAVAAIVVDGGVVRDAVDPGGKGDALILEQVEAGEGAGHGIDGQVLRVLGAPKAGVDIVVDAVEVALIKRADGVLVPFPHPLDEGAIVVGRRLSEWAHWVPLCTVPTWARDDEAPTNSRMVTF